MKDGKLNSDDIMEILHIGVVVTEPESPYVVKYINPMAQKLLLDGTEDELSSLRDSHILSNELVQNLLSMLSEAKKLGHTEKVIPCREPHKRFHISVKYVENGGQSYFVSTIGKHSSAIDMLTPTLIRDSIRGAVLSLMHSDNSNIYMDMYPFLHEIAKNMKSVPFIREATVVHKERIPHLLFDQGKDNLPGISPESITNVCIKRCEPLWVPDNEVIAIPFAIGKECLLDELPYVFIFHFQPSSLNDIEKQEFVSSFQEIVVLTAYLMNQHISFQKKQEAQEETLIRPLIHKIKNQLFALEPEYSFRGQNGNCRWGENYAQLRYIVHVLNTSFRTLYYEIFREKLKLGCYAPRKFDPKKKIDKLVSPFAGRLEGKKVKVIKNIDALPEEIAAPEDIFELIISNILIFQTDNIIGFILSNYGSLIEDIELPYLRFIIDGHMDGDKLILKFSTNEDVFLERFLPGSNERPIIYDRSLLHARRFTKSCFNGEIETEVDEKNRLFSVILTLPLSNSS